MAIKPNKTQTIGFRATFAERRLIKNQAGSLKLRLSEYVRLCVLNDIAGRAIVKQVAEVEQLPAIGRE